MQPVVLPLGGTEDSRAAQIHMAWARGEIDEQKAMKLTALHVAETLQDHVARPYPPMPQGLREYHERRLTGFAQREQEMAVLNGKWLDAVWKLASMNHKEYDDLIFWAKWAIKAQAPDSAKRILAHARGFERLGFPESDFKRGCDVQRKDVEERERDKGGA